MAFPPERRVDTARGTVSLRAATALEVFNLPIFEVPPTLDVRSAASYAESHVACAVSVASEDGPSAERLFERILEHDDTWGWMLQFPVVVVYDESTQERASWLAETLCQAIVARAPLQDFTGAVRAERLLRRLAFQCKEILFLRHGDFAAAFGFACLAGSSWTCADFFEKTGPLPRCALLQPRVYLAGRQVHLGSSLLELLGVQRVVVNADGRDVVQGTSGGGGSCPFFEERPEDSFGVAYLKCAVRDRDDEPDLPQVLDGAARFLASGPGAGLVRLHGQSRSAAAICALLMLAGDLCLDAAWALFLESGIKVDSKLLWWDALRQLPLTRRLGDQADEEMAPA